MSNDDHSLEFRQRVLDALGGERTLEEVAREFRIPADLVFSWVRDGVANGTSHPGAAISNERAPRNIHASAGAPSSPPKAALIFSETKTDFRRLLLIALFAVTFAAMILSLWGSGDFHESRAYWRASWRGWGGVGVLIGLVSYPLFRDGRVSRADPEVSVSAFSAIACSALAGAAISGLYAFFAPHFMHRIERSPVRIETTVIERRIATGRGGRCLYLDNAVSSQYATILFCVDERTYANAHVGQKMRIDGLQSWYGFEFKGYALLDK